MGRIGLTTSRDALTPSIRWGSGIVTPVFGGRDPGPHGGGQGRGSDRLTPTDYRGHGAKHTLYTLDLHTALAAQGRRGQAPLIPILEEMFKTKLYSLTGGAEKTNTKRVP